MVPEFAGSKTIANTMVPEFAFSKSIAHTMVCFQNHRKNHDRENHGPRIRWFQKHRKYTMVPEFAGSKTIANQTSAVYK